MNSSTTTLYSLHRAQLSVWRCHGFDAEDSIAMADKPTACSTPARLFIHFFFRFYQYFLHVSFLYYRDGTGDMGARVSSFSFLL